MQDWTHERRRTVLHGLAQLYARHHPLVCCSGQLVGVAKLGLRTWSRDHAGLHSWDDISINLQSYVLAPMQDPGLQGIQARQLLQRAKHMGRQRQASLPRHHGRGPARPAPR
jgi:hypothetical protein